MCSKKKRNPFAAFGCAFGYAARGIARCWRERNFRFHVAAAVHVIPFARHFVSSAAEWCVLLIAVALVLCLEAVNTAVEHAVDLACPDYDERAKIAKDAAAGAVLIAALAATVIACVGLARVDAWQTLWALWKEQWWRPTALGVSLAAWMYLVFRR